MSWFAGLLRALVAVGLMMAGLLVGGTPAAAAPGDPVGYNWTGRSAPQPNSWTSVAYANGVFVAVSYDGTDQVMTSPDGVNWTPRSAPEANLWRSVTYGNGLFVAVSVNGANQVMTSPDGMTWTAQSASASNQWISVTYGNGLFVAVSPEGGVMTSPDGITWTTRNASAGMWYAVTYGNSRFVAVGWDGAVMTSSDGINWVSEIPAANGQWTAVTFGGGTFVAVSYDGLVMASVDGINWDSGTAVAANQWRSVTFGNNLFVAVASSGTDRVMTSTDGITWIARSADSNFWMSVIHGDGKFVAVGIAGTHQVMTSNDLFLTQNGNTLQVVPASGTSPVQYRVQYNTATRIAQGRPWAQWGYNWAGSPTSQSLNPDSNTFDIDLATYAANGSCAAIGMPAKNCPRPLGVMGPGQSMMFQVRTAETANGPLTTSPGATITRL